MTGDTGDSYPGINVTADDRTMLPPIAGFWSRVFAFFFDFLILVVVGQILGWSLSSWWFNLGPYGRFVGLAMIIVYFGLMNSRIFNGQTVGKRILKIAVRDTAGNPISVKRSLVRISILAVPWILNDWALPQFDTAFLDWLITVIVLGIGIAVVYTFIFNRRTGQVIHDMVCGTYVVRHNEQAIVSSLKTARKHWIVSGSLIGLVMVFSGIIPLVYPQFISKMGFTDTTDIQNALENDERFFSVNIEQISTYTNKGATRSMNVSVWYKGKIPDEESTLMIFEIAAVVKLHCKDIKAYDNLRIMVESAFDLGIAWGRSIYFEGGSIDSWFY